MWLQRHKSASIIDISPSSESVITEKGVSRGLVENYEEPTKPKDEDRRNECLEDHLFCAFLGNFASFTIPQSEIIQKPPEKYVDCEQPSKTDTIKTADDIRSVTGSVKISVKASGDSETVLHRSSKRKIRGSKGSRVSSRKSSDKSERVMKIIMARDYDKASHTSTTTQEEPSFALLNFEHLYSITGENSQLMRYLKRGVLKLDFLNGNIYEGEMCFSDKQGVGLYYWEDGSKYEGHFTDNVPNGKGWLEWADMSRYEGFFSNGLRNGSGTLAFRQGGTAGCTYTGTWLEGFKSGKGTYKHSETNWYDGDFEGGLYNGRGTRQYSSGAKYLGQWRNGQQNGTGIILFPNNDMYIGQWKDGKMEGNGKYVWETFLNTEFVFPMHNIYIGQWKNGMRHGVGSLILSTGAVLSTVWDYNKKNGRGRVLCVNGTTIEADPLFVNDILVSMKTVTYKNGVNTDDIESNLSEIQSEVSEIMSEWNLMKNEEPYRACLTPINIPPYFMNIDIHLNKFFQLRDWSKRISSINWHQWLTYMPPGHAEDLNGLCTAFKEPECKLESKKSVFGLSRLQSESNSRVSSRMRQSAKSRGSMKNTLSRITSVNKSSNSEEKCIMYIKRKTNSDMKSTTPPYQKVQQTKYTDEQGNINEHNEEFMGLIYLFEKKWLRNTIIKHMSLLQSTYNRYATLCCREKPNFQPGMMRILLWKLLKDVGCDRTGYSIVDIDRMAAGRNYPFDYVSVSDMTHYFLIIAWELYTKNNLVNENIPGMLAGGFDLFIMEKVTPLNSQKEIYDPLLPNCDTIPLEALYRLYESFGSGLTAKQLITYLTKNNSKDLDKHAVAILPEPHEYFKYILKGQNAILPGGEIIYKASSFPDFEYIKPELRELPEKVESVDLDFLGIIGAEAIINIVVKCCPQIANSSGEILNQNYEICFLEFLDIFTQCINTYLVYRMKFKFDKYDENKIKLISKCLMQMKEESETSLQSGNK